MTYFEEELKKTITAMYPEISDHKLDVGVEFDYPKNAYLITFKRGEDVLTTRIDRKDANDCMRGIQCIYLGVQIAQFIRNFDDRESFSRQAA